MDDVGQTPPANPPPTQLRSEARRLRGIVNLYRTRYEMVESFQVWIWNFQVLNWDAMGNVRPPVAVEMRGTKIEGSVGDGDWVEIEGAFTPGQLLRTQYFMNLTMNAPVAVIVASPLTPEQRH
jgi:hypothetical protein